MRQICCSIATAASLLAVLLLGAGDARADDGPFVAAEGGVSYLSQWATGRLKPGTAAFSVRAGYRGERWDFFGVASQELWFDRTLNGDAVDPILNLGAGIGLTHIDGWIRSSVRGGTSILMFDTRLSEPGQFGAFVEVRPAGFRLPLGDHWEAELHPLGFVLTSPVLTEIPLFKASYRTSLAVEVAF